MMIQLQASRSFVKHEITGLDSIGRDEQDFADRHTSAGRCGAYHFYAVNWLKPGEFQIFARNYWLRAELM
jgi:hypothetical protein